MRPISLFQEDRQMATGIGETLVAARRQQGVALSDAAAETRVRESYLAALEEEDFAALGGDVYVKGFLRSYARFLRLDPEPLIATYRTHYERPGEESSPLAHQPVAPMPAESRPALIVGAGAVAILVAVLAIIGLVSRGDDPESDLAGAPPPVETTLPTPADVAPTDGNQPGAEATAEPTEDATEMVPADGVELVLELDGGPSWMRVTVDGVTQLEGEQPEGERLTFSADDSITVRLGDAGVVRVTVNGEDRGMLGARAEVVEQTFTAEDAA
jgi:cytoskeleton protein RodZ